MTGKYRIGDTPARWRALTRAARHSLIRHLARQFVVIVVLYALLALVAHSWWKPLVSLVAIAVATAVCDRIRVAYRARRPARGRTH